MSFICLNCIRDESLRESLVDGASTGTCEFCDAEDVVGIELEELAGKVDEPLREFCQKGQYEPQYNAVGSDLVQEGDSLVGLLQEELEIDYEPAEELAGILEAAESSGRYEPFYEVGQNYHRKYLSSWPYSERWNDFSERIKHQARFFDDVAKGQLAEILGEPGSTEASQLPIIEAGPGTRIPVIYRARRAESDDHVREMLAQPAAQLGPPQGTMATAGRMNPAGISVFYGALSEDTAIAEVRPFVASPVVVGRFIPTRRFRLLDLSQIGTGFTGSIFHSNYTNRAARVRFLEGFQYLIAKPIQPRDEQLEYIPTQAVAEHVSNVLGFDGILYASAQIGTVSSEFQEPTPYVSVHELTDEELGQHNLVLFGQAALVVQEMHGPPDPNGNPPRANDGVLNYQANSARIVKVTGVHYSYADHYVRTGSDQEAQNAGSFDISELDIFDL